MHRAKVSKQNIEQVREEIVIKGRLYSSSYRMLGMSLLIIIFLSSCMQFGLFPNSLDAEEVPTPGSIDPEMEFSSKYLICPTVPDSSPIIPPGPYDEDLGDCALKGKSAEIEAWLTELEEIAAGCQANREPYWSDTLAARDLLDTKIDDYWVIEFAHVEVEQPEEEAESPGVLHPLYLDHVGPASDSSCPLYESPLQSDTEYREYPETPFYFTAWLVQIGEDVGWYCTLIDEIIQPLWRACDAINFYQDCQEPNPGQYHAIVESQMSVAQTNYDYTDFFYTHTLQTTGWGNFREAFSETSLDCPLDPQTPSTTFTFSMNAFGRSGPSSEYPKVFTFLELQSVKIIGRNNSEPPWWLVVIPGTSDRVWVSNSTGSALGHLENLEVLPDPPLERCSKDLNETDCITAGGTWEGKDTPSPYCECP